LTHFLSEILQFLVVLANMLLFGFLGQFLLEITQKHSDVQSCKHHICNEADNDEKSNSLPAYSSIIFVHERGPVFIEEKIKNAEQRGGKRLKIIDERFTIHVHLSSTVESHPKCEEQFCNLLEHDSKTETEKQEGLDLDDCACEDENDFFLVYENIIADVEDAHESDDFEAAKNKSNSSLTVNH